MAETVDDVRSGGGGSATTTATLDTGATIDDATKFNKRSNAFYWNLDENDDDDDAVDEEEDNDVDNEVSDIDEDHDRINDLNHKL